MSLQLDNIFNSWGPRKWVEGVFGGLGSVDRLNWGVLIELVGLVAEVEVGVGVGLLGVLLLLWVLLVLFLSKLAWLSNLVITITLIYPAILPIIIILNIPDRHIILNIPDRHLMIIALINNLMLLILIIIHQ